MKKIIIPLLIIAFSIPILAKNNQSELYKFNAVTLKGEKISLKTFQGKIILIVNTASKCGFTPQYEGLEKLYTEYKDKGLVILGFPCNQFGNQEPGTATDIANFCSLNYNVTFPMFQKINVNGDDADPIYIYIKNALPGTLGNDIKWNFTKFLFDQHGKPIKRYGSSTKPESITEDIVKLISLK